MPNPFRHSSAVLEVPDEQELFRSPISNKNDQNPGDWHYGTEELLEALPQLWTRSLLYLLIVFSATVIPWAMVSKVDETGNARGRLQPKGETQRLDSPAAGSVISVKAKEGEEVKAGQELLQLESDILKSEIQQVQTKLEGLQNRLPQLELVKNQLLVSIQVQEQQNQSQALEKMAQVNQAQQNVDARESNYELQKLEKLTLVNQAQQSLSSSRTAIKLVESRLNRDLKEIERFRPLFKAGAIPQIKIVELEKTAEESRQMYERSQAEIKQAELRVQEEQNRYQAIMNQASADIEQAKLRLKEQESGYESVVNAGKLAVLRNQEQLKDMQAQTTALQSEIAQTNSQIKSLKLQQEQRVVKAPVDGTIFELPIQKPGSVLQPGQMVAQIAPKGTPFVLRAQIASNESGFIRVGMPVKLKFDAYPFQDYGIVNGKITWISTSSKVQETIQGNIENYELEISLDQSYIQNGNKRIPLTPGQTATAEIVVRQRRIIDFILDPFKKLQAGGLQL